MSARDPELMRRAIRLAERGWGSVHPNPLVGALITRDDAVIAEAWHTAYGAPHAEAAALAAAGARSQGATLYVTLEPCTHHGQTPPCTDAIIAAGIARVVYGAADPNPAAAGGATTLRAAGIAVDGGIAEDEVRAQNRIFFHRHEQRRCYVALKLAQSLDARLGEHGRRTAVTGARAAAETQRLRAGHDAIMIGGETARVDDPLLTVRDAPARVPPARVVVTTAAALPPDSQLVRSARDVPVFVCCARDAPAENVAQLEARGARMVYAARSPAGLDPADVLAQLRAAGIHSILCEGGGRLGVTLLAARLVDRLYLFIAPRLFGASGVPAFPGGETGPGAWRLTATTSHGNDALLVLDAEPAAA